MAGTIPPSTLPSVNVNNATTSFPQGLIRIPLGRGSMGRSILQMKKLRLRQVSPCPELQKLVAGYGALVFLTPRPMHLMIGPFHLPCSWIPSQNKDLPHRAPEQLLTRRFFPHLPTQAMGSQGFLELKKVNKKQNLSPGMTKETRGPLPLRWQDHLSTWSDEQLPSYPSSDGRWHWGTYVGERGRPPQNQS